MVVHAQQTTGVNDIRSNTRPFPPPVKVKGRLARLTVASSSLIKNWKVGKGSSYCEIQLQDH